MIKKISFVFLLINSLSFTQYQVIAGAQNTFIKKSNGTLFGFGDNVDFKTTAFTFNQTFRSDSLYPYIRTIEPVIWPFPWESYKVGLIDSIDLVSAEYTNVLGRSDIYGNKHNYSFGQNWAGQAGLNVELDSIQYPTKIQDFSFVDIANGGGHILGLTEDGLVYSWGQGNSGKLGLGDEQNRLEPYIKNFKTLINQIRKTET